MEMELCYLEIDDLEDIKSILINQLQTASAQNDTKKIDRIRQLIAKIDAEIKTLDPFLS